MQNPTDPLLHAPRLCDGLDRLYPLRVSLGRERLRQEPERERLLLVPRVVVLYRPVMTAGHRCGGRFARRLLRQRNSVKECIRAAIIALYKSRFSAEIL